MARIYPYVDPINPEWVLWLVRQIKRSEIDVLIVRNIRLGLVGRLAAWFCNIPFVADISENYEAIASLNYRRAKWLPSIRPPFLVAAICKLVVRLSDHVWVVCDENAQRFRKTRANGSAPTVIGNYPTEEEVAALRSPVYKSHKSNQMTLIYAGNLDGFRGLDIPIRALAIRKSVRFRLVIVGSGPAEKSLRDLVTRLGLEDIIEFHGHLPRSELLLRVASSDVGVLPHYDSPLTASTQPNKLFDYMAAGLPIISTPMKPVSRVLTAAHCGLIVSTDPEDWRREFDRLFADSELRGALRAKALSASDNLYQWRHVRSTVIADITSLICDNSEPRSRIR